MPLTPIAGLPVEECEDAQHRETQCVAQLQQHYHGDRVAQQHHGVGQLDVLLHLHLLVQPQAFRLRLRLYLLLRHQAPPGLEGSNLDSDAIETHP